MKSSLFPFDRFVPVDEYELFADDIVKAVAGDPMELKEEIHSSVIENFLEDNSNNTHIEVDPDL